MTLGQLNKVRQKVLVQDQGELVPLGILVGDSWHYPQEALEAHLSQTNSDKEVIKFSFLE